MQVIANYGFHDMEADVYRQCDEAFEADEKRAAHLVSLGVARPGKPVEPKPKASKPKAPKKKTSK